MTRYVVVGADGSAASSAALRWAAVEASSRGYALRVVTVVPRRPPGLGGTSHGGVYGHGKAGRIVENAVAELASAYPRLDIVAREIAGVPEEILGEVGRGAELLVVATRGLGGFTGLRLGSVALGVAAGAPCAVALVPADAEGADVPEVVVGIDAHHPDPGALDLAFDAARRREVRLRAVSAWRFPSPYDEQAVMPVEEDRADWEDQELQVLEDVLRDWREKYPSVGVLPDLRLFGPADALVRASGSADLLVIGRGEARTHRGFGGVAHAVAHHTRCPLVLAPRH